MPQGVFPPPFRLVGPRAPRTMNCFRHAAGGIPSPFPTGRDIRSHATRWVLATVVSRGRCENGENFFGGYGTASNEEEALFSVDEDKRGALPIHDDGMSYGLMGDKKFDGKKLRTRNGSAVGAFEGKNYRDARGRRVGTLDGNSICDVRGAKIAEVKGEDIRDTAGRRVATLSNVRKVIEGSGGANLAGLWILFIR